MERNLEKTLDDTYNQEGIVGCILTDRAGLCLGVKGNASSDSAGLIAAVADQVAKLEPKSGVPIISLQNDNRHCIIHRKGPVVGAIYKDVST
ncbi:ragulator complex protein LAMTOR5 homolog isoform X2 [Ooceraea biroi]|uniref:ragulator complex protein LAMTOR5 homolog isoform X2 n=1 Tax=Ooceraea biroi TaxID=2015173 RepID=UPI0005B95513|nr:ragulator complex protein LAMTOR5 homolog isoform X2 [Ooceraea biroi]